MSKLSGKYWQCMDAFEPVAAARGHGSICRSVSVKNCQVRRVEAM